LTKPEALTRKDGPAARKDGPALRHVVDLALRYIRAKDRMPHLARNRMPHPTHHPRAETPWVMSADGVINAPADDEDHTPEAWPVPRTTKITQKGRRLRG
jgi:hypothetical protein